MTTKTRSHRFRMENVRCLACFRYVLNVVHMFICMPVSFHLYAARDSPTAPKQPTAPTVNHTATPDDDPLSILDRLQSYKAGACM